MSPMGRALRLATTRAPPRPAPLAHHRRSLHALSSSELRTAFLGYFRDHGHEVIPSASLVPPGDDASLLFTNAGMVPFKQLFLGTERRRYTRATSAQRCVRAGGKHNDLAEVGRTRRHHTQFEMLGNFSFGDYFKEQAIVYAWTFLTETLALPRDRLLVTVLEGDDETRGLWRRITGLDDARIRDCGPEDNFWAMGDTGPCGPCSEIFWDLGEHISDPDERFLELWNLVFMQFHRQPGDETLHPLPRPSVDTGMGLERMASVLQGVPSNYHTDLFAPILGAAASVLDAKLGGHHQTTTLPFTKALAVELDPQRPQFGATPEIQALRILADHLRATYAMLGDGIFPSNVGRGYVLRRILRRAMRVAQRHGVQGPFLTEIVVPEWQAAPGFVQMQAIVANEERAFAEMLTSGQRALDKALQHLHHGQVLPGREAFRLYDTFGIPLDVTQVLAEERGLRVDARGFEAAMEEHRRRATESSAFTSQPTGPTATASTADSESAMTTFVGYDELSVRDARIVGLWADQQQRGAPKAASSTSTTSTTCWLRLEPCPFYAEGGGQVGDRGEVLIISGDHPEPLRLVVRDTKRLANDTIALHCELPTTTTTTTVEDADQKTAFRSVEDLERWLDAHPPSRIEGHVDQTFRRGCAVHHSATHLLQRALKEVLGEHVTQAGSLVSTDRLRFDFAHFGAMSEDELEAVEARVNAWALADLPIETAELPRAEAAASGAICNFGEKYGDIVRVVRIGGDLSREFCGGTHAPHTSALFPFALLSEGSVAAGTRRIEAVAGLEGAKYLQTKDQALRQLARELDTTPAKVPERVAKLQRQLKQLESHAQGLGDMLASLPSLPRATSSEGLDLHVLDQATSSSGGDWARVLRRRAEILQQREPTKAHVVVLGRQIVCVADGQRVHAGKWLQGLVRQVGGRGGGNGTFAQGSLHEDATLERLVAAIEGDGGRDAREQ